MDFKQDIVAFESALLSLDRLSAVHILSEVNAFLGPASCVETIVVPAMEHIGVGWDDGKLALSQLYMSGRICEEAVNTILPPEQGGLKKRPRMAITVIDDYHFLGKRIVYSLLRSSGFDLQDYGHVEDLDDLVNRVRDHRLEILLISVLMLRSTLRVKELTAKIKQAGLDVKVVVGGAPFRFDRRLWKEIGADAMAANAAEGIEIIKRIMENLP